ncbi:MAG TPA: hypothetical protein VE569_00975 [Acidimicrobiia bacterium]|jgi:hypothetical protein|nr:hypothetical protein [Acidimicrobiia bacterium]
MAQIDVASLGERTFQVTVTEQWSTTTHEVTVKDEDLDRLAGDASESDFVAASFRFLLDREPKESIMTSFDLSVIGRYFPEFSERVGDYL